LRFYENISTASAGFFVSFLRMMLSGIFVPSFEVANSRVTSMSANETGEVLRSTVYRGAVGCIALATLPTLPIERLALRLHETLCLAISIVSGAFHGRARTLLGHFSHSKRAKDALFVASTRDLVAALFLLPHFAVKRT
jgi:hypothetical protein